MKNASINIIMCGIGGQGIASATRKLHEHCLIHDWQCISAVYKGGAQRLGTVKAEIRLFPPGSNSITHKSSQIIPGTLDALIVLEQWEGLRQLPMCGTNTLIVLNQFMEFPPGNRKSHEFESDPQKLWKKLTNTIIENDYSTLAVTQGGHSKYTAINMINEVIEKLQLPIQKIN